MAQLAKGDSEGLQRITREIYESGGIVSPVCHGYCALLNTRLSDGSYLIAGRRMTGFAWTEEVLACVEKLVPYNAEEEAKQRGALNEGARLGRDASGTSVGIEISIPAGGYPTFDSALGLGDNDSAFDLDGNGASRLWRRSAGADSPADGLAWPGLRVHSPTSAGPEGHDVSGLAFDPANPSVRLSSLEVTVDSTIAATRSARHNAPGSRIGTAQYASRPLRSVRLGGGTSIHVPGASTAAPREAHSRPAARDTSA